MEQYLRTGSLKDEQWEYLHSLDKQKWIDSFNGVSPDYNPMSGDFGIWVIDHFGLSNIKHIASMELKMNLGQPLKLVVTINVFPEKVGELIGSIKPILK